MEVRFELIVCEGNNYLCYNTLNKENYWLSAQGPGVMSSDDKKKGLLPRVVNGLFEALKLSDEVTNYVIKLSMVLENTLKQFRLDIKFSNSYLETCF